MSRWLLIAGVAVVLLVVAAAGAVRALMDDEEPPQKRGSAAVEFDPGAEPEAAPPKKADADEPWPTLGYDVARSKVSPYDHRPPYRRTWRLDSRDQLEYPPSVAYGNVYIAQQKGLFFAVNGKTGRPVFKTKNYKRCAASSPTIKGGVVYQSYMHFAPCPQGADNPNGFLEAMDAKTGRTKWRYWTKPVESSPLLRNGILYIGSWDGNVHAIRAKTGRPVWKYQTGAKVNTSAAYSGGRIFIGNQSGTRVRAQRAHRQARVEGQARPPSSSTPRRPWPTDACSSAPPTAPCTPTASAAASCCGPSAWAPTSTRPPPSYDRKVYAGTYDGKLFALDAATGDVRWRREMPSAVHGPPAVMAGLVYASTCSSCGSEASRYVKMGRDSTTALDARTGRTVWRNNAGKYASPVVADRNRVYLTGRSYLYALEPRERPKRRRRRSSGRRIGRGTEPLAGVDQRGGGRAHHGPDEVVVVEGAADEEQHQHRHREAGGPTQASRARCCCSSSHDGQRQPGEQRDDRERVRAAAVVEDPRADHHRRQAVAHDPVGAGAELDRVLVEGHRVGDQERQHHRRPPRPRTPAQRPSAPRARRRA